MDQLLEKHKVPHLTLYEIDNLNGPMTVKELEFIIWKLPWKKTSSLNGFAGEVYQIFKEELTPILHNLSRQFQETLSNPFYHANITMKKDNTRKYSTKQNKTESTDQCFSWI